MDRKLNALLKEDCINEIIGRRFSAMSKAGISSDHHLEAEWREELMGKKMAELLDIKENKRAICRDLGPGQGAILEEVSFGGK